MAQVPADQQILELIIKSIVNHPDAVSIERKVDEMGVLLLLKVHPEDMGIVIGRNGSLAKAIRTILRVVGLKNKARVNFKIAEPESSGSQPAEKSAEKVADKIVEDLKL